MYSETQSTVIQYSAIMCSAVQGSELKAVQLRPVQYSAIHFSSDCIYAGPISRTQGPRQGEEDSPRGVWKGRRRKRKQE